MLKLLRKFDPFLDRLNYCMAWMAGILLIYAMLSVAYNVFSRYLFNCPVVWVLEINEYSLLYTVFLSAAFVLQNEGHVRVDLLLNRLRPRAQARLNAITSIAGAIVCLILTIYGARITWDALINHVPTLEFLKVPYFIVLIIIPIGSFLLTVQFLRRSAKYWSVQKSLPGDEGARGATLRD